MKFDNVKSVYIDKRRWDVRIYITDGDSVEHVLIASSDSFFTEHNGIWFGTEEEHEKEIGY